MEDIVARVGRLETSMSDVRVDVAAIKAKLDHLATGGEIGELRGRLSATETSLIKWVVGTAMACAGPAFAAAKLIS
jgi:hypothetical protein